MAVDAQHDEFLLLWESKASLARSVLDLMPCAVALWSPDRKMCLLNRQARQLTGFSEQDFQKDASIWKKRIHAEDRSLFSATWKKLLGGEQVGFCDYRFSPKSSDKSLWLRELSVPRQDLEGNVVGVSSVYINISDLKGNRLASKEKGPASGVPGIIDGLVHEIQNDLQIIASGLDLMRLSDGPNLASGPLLEGVERISKSVQEIREFFFPSDSAFARGDPGVILEGVVREMEKQLDRQGIHLRLHRRSSVPLIQLDTHQFRRAVEWVLEFCCFLLSRGGELEIGAGMREKEGHRYVELQVISSSATSLAIEERDVFRPFLRVNGHQVGLSMMLAHEVMRRHKGEIVFHKENPQKGLFRILLEVR